MNPECQERNCHKDIFLSIHRLLDQSPCLEGKLIDGRVHFLPPAARMQPRKDLLWLYLEMGDTSSTIEWDRDDWELTKCLCDGGFEFQYGFDWNRYQIITTSYIIVGTWMMHCNPQNPEDWACNLLDYEHDVTQSLKREPALGAPGCVLSWQIASIDRGQPLTEGDQIPCAQFVLTVDVDSVFPREERCIV